MEQAVPNRRDSVEEYPQFEQGAEEKHEFRDGEIVAMSGGSLNHSLIIANIIGEMRNQLKGKPCKVFESNLKVRIARTVRYSYPDAGVVCDEVQLDPADPGQSTILNPRLIVEVLSPSTELFDRGEKFRRYLRIESLAEYVLVSQSEPCVETFWRQPGGGWLFTPFMGSDSTARLNSLSIQLPLKEIYAGVVFPESSAV